MVQVTLTNQDASISVSLSVLFDSCLQLPLSVKIVHIYDISLSEAVGGVVQCLVLRVIFPSGCRVTQFSYSFPRHYKNLLKSNSAQAPFIPDCPSRACRGSVLFFVHHKPICRLHSSWFCFPFSYECSCVSKSFIYQLFHNRVALKEY